MTLPLSGLTVVSFEQAVAAPLCSRHLGDLGARIIKVENRDGGDSTRHYDEAVRGLAAHFVWLNRNKESVSLDLRHPEAVEILDRLLSRADVVIQNLAPGSAAQRGIAAAQVVARYPRVVAVDISGYGVGGPYEHKRAYDLLIQAEGGVCSITGTPGAPAKAGPPMADVGSALYALAGILAALVERDRTGVGTAIRIGMFDVVAEWMGFALQYTLHTGEERQPTGMGTPMVAPYGAYPTRDGETVVLGTTSDREWQRLARQVIDRPDLAEDSRFSSNAARCAAREQLDEVIGAWTSRRNLVEIQASADAAGIGNARYNTVARVLEHPQLNERDRWRDVGSPVGAVPVLLAPFESDTWDQRTDDIPALGAHTDLVLAELGYAPPEIEQLRIDGAV